MTTKLSKLQKKISELRGKYNKIFEQRDKVSGLSEEHEKLTCELESVRSAMIDLEDKIQDDRIALLKDELKFARQKVDDITDDLEIQERRVALLKDKLESAKRKVDDITDDLEQLYL